MEGWLACQRAELSSIRSSAGWRNRLKQELSEVQPEEVKSPRNEQLRVPEHIGKTTSWMTEWQTRTREVPRGQVDHETVMYPHGKEGQKPPELC